MLFNNLEQAEKLKTNISPRYIDESLKISDLEFVILQDECHERTTAILGGQRAVSAAYISM